MTALPTILVDGDGDGTTHQPRGTWFAESYVNIDEGVAAADGALITGPLSATGATSFTLAAFPADLGNVDTLTITVKHKTINWVNDFVFLAAKIVDSADGSLLAGGTYLGTYQLVDTSPQVAWETTGPVTFATLDTAATKTQWDRAVLVLYQAWAAIGGTDAFVAKQIDTLDITGTYTASGGTTPVGQSSQAVWDVHTPIGQATQTVWDAHTSVGQTEQAVWDVNTSVGQTEQLVWDAHTSVAQTSQAVWDVHTTAGQTEQTVWDVHTSVAQTEQAVWDVNTSVGQTTQTVWDVQVTGTTPVGQATQTVWDVHAHVTVDEQAVWDVHKRATVDEQMVWDVTTPVAQTTQTVWAVNTTAGQATQTVWGVYAPVAGVVQAVWDTNTIVYVFVDQGAALPPFDIPDYPTNNPAYRLATHRSQVKQGTNIYIIGGVTATARQPADMSTVTRVVYGGHDVPTDLTDTETTLLVNAGYIVQQ